MDVDDVEPDNDEDAVGLDTDDEDVDGVNGKAVEEEAEKKALEERQTRFRKLWMGKMVSAFGNDLEQLRKVSSYVQTRAWSWLILYVSNLPVIRMNPV
jgi:hypothetical protein